MLLIWEDVVLHHVAGSYRTLSCCRLIWDGIVLLIWAVIVLQAHMGWHCVAGSYGTLSCCRLIWDGIVLLIWEVIVLQAHMGWHRLAGALNG